MPQMPHNAPNRTPGAWGIFWFLAVSGGGWGHDGVSFLGRTEAEHGSKLFVTVLYPNNRKIARGKFRKMMEFRKLQ